MSGTPASFDYLVVGGGAAGCVLAARLSEDGAARVLLLEAGPADRDRFIHLPVGFYRMTSGPLTWGYTTVPLRHADDRRMVFPQGRVLGGGSSINAMVYTRGHRLDYDAWAQQEGCTGWSYAEVLPYFRRLEDNERLCDPYHGTDGPIGICDPISPHPLSKVFVRAAQEWGLPYNPDFNGERQEGCGLYQVFQRGARRCSAAVGYLKPALARPNLTVQTGCSATRIVVERGRAVGVEYREGSSAERKRALAGREVILASGAVGSPKLLLLSGIGPADELKAVGVDVVHDLPAVGKNLQDHIDVFVISELAGAFSYCRHVRPHKMLWSGLEYVLFKRGPVTSNLAEAGGFGYADPDARSPDLQFHFLPGAGIEAGVPPIDGYGCTLNSCFLRPKSRGTVRLAGSDPLAAPLIDPNYWAEPYDFEMSLRGFEVARAIMAQPAFRKYVKREHLPGAEVRTRDELAAYARRFGKTDYHPVGACRMGLGEDAVVDPELRVRGLEGLRVCDSSIMPQLVSSNTNAATIMIGEKAADLIRGQALRPAQEPGRPVASEMALT